MAVSNFDALTLAEFLKGISDSVIQDNVYLNHMKEKGRIKFGCGGNGFEGRIRVLKANIGGVVTDQNQGNAKTINTVRTIVGRYRPYLWRLFENQLELDRNQYAPAASQIADQEEEDLNMVNQEASERIGVHMYEDGATLFTGDVAGATPPEGLDSIIDSTGTYFGLSRATYPNLAAQELTCVNPSSYDDGVSQNLQLKMDQLWVACSGGAAGEGGKIGQSVATKKETPDLIISTSTLFRTYRAGLNPQNQYTGDRQNPQKQLAFATAMLEWDTFCKANRMFFVNSKHMEVRVVGPQMVRKMMEIQSASPVGKIHVIGAQLQQWSKQPRYHGKLVTSGLGAA